MRRAEITTPSASAPLAREKAMRSDAALDPFDDFMADIEDGEPLPALNAEDADPPLKAEPEDPAGHSEPVATERMSSPRSARLAGVPLFLLLLAALGGTGWRIHELGAERAVLATQLRHEAQAERQSRRAVLAAQGQLAQAQRALAAARNAPQPQPVANVARATETALPPTAPGADCATPKSVLRGRGL